MNADWRIVPSHYVNTVLAEEHATERTLTTKNTLQHSGKKIDKVANKWMEYNGINCLARVMLKNIGKVPAPIRHKNHTDSQTWSHHHEKHASHHQVKHHEAHNITHDDHWHESRNGHSHHVDENHSHNRGAFMLGILNTIVSEIFGYLFKAVMVLIIFAPTRTACALFLVVVGMNAYFDMSLPSFTIAGVALVVHIIFAGATRLAQSNGEHGGWHADHGGDEHGGHSAHASHGHH